MNFKNHLVYSGNRHLSLMGGVLAQDERGKPTAEYHFSKCATTSGTADSNVRYIQQSTHCANADEEVYWKALVSDSRTAINGIIGVGLGNVKISPNVWNGGSLLQKTNTNNASLNIYSPLFMARIYDTVTGIQEFMMGKGAAEYKIVLGQDYPKKYSTKYEYLPHYVSYDGTDRYFVINGSTNEFYAAFYRSEHAGIAFAILSLKDSCGSSALYNTFHNELTEL